MAGDAAAGTVARRRMTSGELAIWRSFIETAAELGRILGAQLQESGCSPADYQVLLALKEADGRRLRSSELAASIDWERSRLSHHLARMERRGLIRRSDCATDRRGAGRHRAGPAGPPPRRWSPMTGGPLSSAQLPRIAVLGAGHTGPVIARVAMAAGYQASIAASGDPENIELIAQVLAPGAKPRWAADAVAEADLVVVAIPLHKFATLDPALLAGQLVVDTMNYWPAVDGVQETFEDRQYGSSEIVQQWLARSTVVKTLNHIGYHELEDERRPRGLPERPALGVAGDDSRAVDWAGELIGRIGYCAVRFDRLSAGRLLEPGGPVFGASLHRTEFELAVRAEAA